ncbi:MAG: polysaccharide deacetylase family protein [Syntrophaceae bacterium]
MSGPGHKPAHNPAATPAVLSGIAALALAAFLWFIRPELAILPLAGFAVSCLVASLCPSYGGFFLETVSRAKTKEPVVAVTFDDGPDPLTTPPLLELLDRHGVKAAFFVAGGRAAMHGELIEAIIARGHEIGNHSYHHDPLLMLRGRKTIIREIETTQEALQRYGVSPLAFRPPVGVTNSLLGGILDNLGLYVLNFSCRGYDFGNRRLKGLSGKVLKRVKPGDIILLHDTRPPGTTYSGPASEINTWLREVDLVLSGLKLKGLRAVPLGELIGRPVMVKTFSKSP